jgi:hypothetical protein
MSHGRGLHHQGMTSVGRDHLETITRRLRGLANRVARVIHYKCDQQ